MTRRLLHDPIVYRSLTLVFLFLVTLSVSAQWSAPQEEGGVPAYNAGPPPKGTQLPAILGKADLWGADAQYPYQTHAYELAAKIPNVLHQQPCYCYCDRMGHNSLHSCFENTHGARCATCLKELYYSYQQHQKGKTAVQIRSGIIQRRMEAGGSAGCGDNEVNVRWILRILRNACGAGARCPAPIL